MNFQHLARENIEKAIAKQKGLLFWSYQLGRRKRSAKFEKYRTTEFETYERRFICAECIENFWAPPNQRPWERFEYGLRRNYAADLWPVAQDVRHRLVQESDGTEWALERLKIDAERS